MIMVQLFCKTLSGMDFGKLLQLRANFSVLDTKYTNRFFFFLLKWRQNILQTSMTHKTAKQCNFQEKKLKITCILQNDIVFEQPIGNWFCLLFFKDSEKNNNIELVQLGSKGVQLICTWTNVINFPPLVVLNYVTCDKVCNYQQRRN